MPNVQVAVRCRPCLSHEQGSTVGKIETNEVDNTIRIAVSQTNNRVFTVDKVLSETSTQQETFEFVSPMIDHALDGLHATIFAYGQTGSGKTWTIEGLDYVADAHGRPRPKLDTPPSRHGILPRLIQKVFDKARERSGHNPNIMYRLKCSFMQLYNERVSDLLNPATRDAKEGLRIRWTRDDHFQVENLFIFECESADQMRDMFHIGVKEKVMGSHLMNTQSSRSHCVFTIHVHSWDPQAPECLVKSELTLVDLAGSEKLNLLSSNPSQQLLKESIEINTSLLSLGKVITALAQCGGGHGKASSHIPYRDSKLTKLLKHALGGNSMTVMIACISPVDSSVDETMSTLLYAGRARNITNDPRVNEDPRSALIRQLREEIRSLKTELEYYRQLVANGAMDDKLLSGKSLPAATERSATHNPSQQQQQRPNSTGGIDTVALLGSPRKGEEAELADKLIESCRMLKNVMGVNTQLRGAFDRLKSLKEASEKREMELNAENIALRERIEMLESITLADEGNANVSSTPPPSVSSPAQDPAFEHARRTGGAAATQKEVHPPRQQQQNSGSVLRAFSDAAAAYEASSSAAVVGGAQGAAATTRLTFSDYNTKYRNPQKPTSYEDYYGQAKRAMGIASGAQNSQAASLVQDMERLVRNLPKTTQQMVPSSLQSAQAFGSLAFGGNDQETRDLEERRRQRQLRLQQIQAHHNTMQRGFSGGVAPPASSTSASTAGSGAFQPPQNLNLGTAPSQPLFSFSNPVQQQQGPATLSSNSNTGRLFAYLSQEESSRTFTNEQLERLRQRSSSTPNALPTSSSLAMFDSSARGSNNSGAAAMKTPRNKTQIESHQRTLSDSMLARQQAPNFNSSLGGHSQRNRR